MESQRVLTTISTNYVANWSMVSALSELIQNTLDVADTGADITMNWSAGSAWFCDNGSGLELRHLALGVSEKAAGSRGQFGEGFKLALLCFARQGVACSIRSRDWELVPAVVVHPALGVDVLAFDVVGGLVPIVGTTIKAACCESDYIAARARFLWEGAKVAGVLQGAEYRGLVFVNGVGVGSTPSRALWGYNLTGEKAKLLANRDRSSYDASAGNSLVARVLSACSDFGVCESTLKAVVDNDNGAQFELGLWVDRLSSVWATAFRALYGEKAVLVTDSGLTPLVVYHGFNPVSMVYAWRSALASAGVKLDTDIVGEVSRMARVPAPLSKLQRSMLAKGVKLVSAFMVPDWSVKVCQDVLSPSGQKVLGMADPDGKVIWLTVGILLDMRQLVGTLIHELAHVRSGCGDTEPGFADELCNIATAVLVGC